MSETPAAPRGIVARVFGRRRLFHSGSLRLRLALALAVAASLPLIVAVALITDREQRAVERQALTGQELLAAALSESVAEYIGRQSDLVVSLAQPELLALPAAQQAALLRTFPVARQIWIRGAPASPGEDGVRCPLCLAPYARRVPDHASAAALERARAAARLALQTACPRHPEQVAV